jgi:hypothetical protein
MADIDTYFCRALLAQVQPDVYAAGKRPFKDAWVWHAWRDLWEFHGPDDYYWYGSASNAYEARYKGWTAWLNRGEALS